jgi:hypothetical protein
MSVSIQLSFTVDFGHNHITSFCADSVTAYSYHVILCIYLYVGLWILKDSDFL